VRRNATVQDAGPRSAGRGAAFPRGDSALPGDARPRLRPVACRVGGAKSAGGPARASRPAPPPRRRVPQFRAGRPFDAPAEELRTLISQRDFRWFSPGMRAPLGTAERAAEDPRRSRRECATGGATGRRRPHDDRSHCPYPALARVRRCDRRFSRAGCPAAPHHASGRCGRARRARPRATDSPWRAALRRAHAAIRGAAHAGHAVRRRVAHRFLRRRHLGAAARHARLRRARRRHRVAGGARRDTERDPRHGERGSAARRHLGVHAARGLGDSGSARTRARHRWTRRAALPHRSQRADRGVAARLRRLLRPSDRGRVPPRGFALAPRASSPLPDLPRLLRAPLRRRLRAPLGEARPLVQLQCVGRAARRSALPPGDPAAGDRRRDPRPTRRAHDLGAPRVRAADAPVEGTDRPLDVERRGDPARRAALDAEPARLSAGPRTCARRARDHRSDLRAARHAASRRLAGIEPPRRTGRRARGPHAPVRDAARRRDRGAAAAGGVIGRPSATTTERSAVTKTRAGIGRDLFTSADHCLVALDHRSGPKARRDLRWTSCTKGRSDRRRTTSSASGGDELRMRSVASGPAPLDLHAPGPRRLRRGRGIRNAAPRGVSRKPESTGRFVRAEGGTPPEGRGPPCRIRATWKPAEDPEERCLPG